MRVSDPPLSSFLIGAGLGTVFWALGADREIVVGIFACGIAYALFYAVIKPHKD